MKKTTLITRSVILMLIFILLSLGIAQTTGLVDRLSFLFWQEYQDERVAGEYEVRIAQTDTGLAINPYNSNYLMYNGAPILLITGTPDRNWHIKDFYGDGVDQRIAEVKKMGGNHIWIGLDEYYVEKTGGKHNSWSNIINETGVNVGFFDKLETIAQKTYENDIILGIYIFGYGPVVYPYGFCWNYCKDVYDNKTHPDHVCKIDDFYPSYCSGDPGPLMSPKDFYDIFNSNGTLKTQADVVKARQAQELIMKKLVAATWQYPNVYYNLAWEIDANTFKKLLGGGNTTIGKNKATKWYNWAVDYINQEGNKINSSIKHLFAIERTETASSINNVRADFVVEEDGNAVKKDGVPFVYWSMDAKYRFAPYLKPNGKKYCWNTLYNDLKTDSDTGAVIYDCRVSTGKYEQYGKESDDLCILGGCEPIYNREDMRKGLINLGVAGIAPIWQSYVDADAEERAYLKALSDFINTNPNLQTIEDWADPSAELAKAPTPEGGGSTCDNCTDWVNGTCGGGSCQTTQMSQTRTCTPSGCSIGSRCIANSTCGGAQIPPRLPPGTVLKYDLNNDNSVNIFDFAKLVSTWRINTNSFIDLIGMLTCWGTNTSAACVEAGGGNGGTETVPPTPTNLQANDLTTTSVRWTWDDVANENRYEINFNTYGYGDQTAQMGTNVTSLTVSNGAPNTYHTFKIKACNTAGCSAAASQTITFPNTGTVPPIPTGLQANDLTTTSVRWTWNDVVGEDEYQIIYSSYGGQKTNDPVIAGTTSYLVTTGYANTTHTFSVRACNTAGCSAATSQTITFPSTNTIPPAPTGLSFSSVSSTSMTWAWTDVAGETKYEINYSIAGTAFTKEVGANIVSYAVTGGSSGAKIIFRIKACNGSGCSTETMGMALFGITGGGGIDKF